MKGFSGALGYLLVGGFIYLCVTRLTSSPQMFLNLHGLAIVVGGLFVASIASFPSSLLYQAVKSFFKAMSPNSKVSSKLAVEIVQVGRLYQKNVGELEKSAEQFQEPFLKQSINLMLEGIPSETIVEILNKRIEEKSSNTQNNVNVFLTLSKYSPALGLAATVLGLVDLLAQLASADMAKLGYGMAIALSATFYGIILSNLVFAPLSEMILASGDVEIKEMEMVREGVLATMERKNPLIIGEVVNSYLDESRRIDFTEQKKMKLVA